MNRTLKKKQSKRKLFWLVFFALLFIYLAYYQFLYHSRQVNSNIYVLDKVLYSHLSEIWTVKFSPNGNWVASGSVDSTVKIWNKESGKIILTIKQPNGVTYIAFSPDGNYLATASYDEKIRLWKLPVGTLIKEFRGHKGTVWSLDFSPDGEMIASCGEDATVKLWDIATGKMKRRYKVIPAIFGM
jgi:WD40 repeat protein